MINVRKIIRDRMKELGWGPYDLGKAVAGKMAKQTVYNFVKRGSAMNATKLGHVLSALDLDIVPKGGRK